MRLINFLVSIRKLPPLSQLTGDEERFLFELHDLWARNGAMQVADTYALASQKSPSTAYRLLASLREKGLLDIDVDAADKRKRHVRFTDTAHHLFASLE